MERSSEAGLSWRTRTRMGSRPLAGAELSDAPGMESRRWPGDPERVVGMDQRSRWSIIFGIREICCDASGVGMRSMLSNPVVALRLPPANGCDAFGVGSRLGILETGGFAALNHRLMAGDASGVRQR